MKFPLIGSVSLVTLFILFKLLPAEAVNFTLSFYFLLMGSIATTATMVPLFQHYFSESMQSRRYGPYKPRLPDWTIALIPSQSLKQELKTAQVASSELSGIDLSVGVVGNCSNIARNCDRGIVFCCLSCLYGDQALVLQQSLGTGLCN